MSAKSWCICVVLLGIYSLACGEVNADVVRSPPKSCPVGSVPTTSHCGPECRVYKCKSHKDCRKGYVCAVVPVCVRTVSRTPCGLVPAKYRNKKYTVYVGGGRCTNDKSCGGKGKCETKWRICVGKTQVMIKVPPTSRPKVRKSTVKKSATAEPPQKKSDCSTFGVRAGYGGSYVLLSLLLLAFVARGKRR